jgi:hypothetical protein
LEMPKHGSNVSQAQPLDQYIADGREQGLIRRVLRRCPAAGSTASGSRNPSGTIQLQVPRPAADSTSHRHITVVVTRSEVTRVDDLS